MCCSVLQCVAVCYMCIAIAPGAFGHVSLCRSVLQGIVVCCSVLQCVTACCSVLQRVAVCEEGVAVVPGAAAHVYCVAVCCSVWQNVAVCRSVSQHAVCGSVLRVRFSRTRCPRSCILCHNTLQCVQSASR